MSCRGDDPFGILKKGMCYHKQGLFSAFLFSLGRGVVIEKGLASCEPFLLKLLMFRIPDSARKRRHGERP